MYGLVTCDGCDGCGKVTDNVWRIPWTWHARELKDANDKPLFQEVQPTTCGKCGGLGRIPKSKYNPWHHKKRKS